MSTAPTSTTENAISNADAQRQGADSEFVSLLETITNKFLKDPSVIGFFMDEVDDPVSSA